MTEAAALQAPDTDNPIVRAAQLKADIVDCEDALESLQKAMQRQFETDNAALISSLTTLRKQYRQAVDECVAQNIFEHGRYRIVNKARVSRPINIGLFRERFRDIFERIATVTKKDAIAAISAAEHCTSKVAEAKLSDVCDEIVGEPAWELTIEVKKGVQE